MTTTPYSSIYNRFYKYIKDYRFGSLDKQELEEIFESYLQSGSVWFRFCEHDLYDRDDVLKQFNSVLTPEEQEILAKQMVIEWLNPEVYNIEDLKQTLSHKDFQMYSQANHIDKKLEIYNQAKKEVGQLMTLYSYNKNAISELR